MVAYFFSFSFFLIIDKEKIEFTEKFSFLLQFLFPIFIHEMFNIFFLFHFFSWFLFCFILFDSEEFFFFCNYFLCFSDPRLIYVLFRSTFFTYWRDFCLACFAQIMLGERMSRMWFLGNWRFEMKMELSGRFFCACWWGEERKFEFLRDFL